MPRPERPVPTILIIGASRGLGYAMAAEFLGHGWNVVGTVRGGTRRTPLHDLADTSQGRLEIEVLDINDPPSSTRYTTSCQRDDSTCCS